MNLKKVLSFVVVVSLFASWLLFWQTTEDNTLGVDDKKRDVSTLYRFDSALDTHYNLEFKQDSSILGGDLFSGELSYSYLVDAVLNMRVLESAKDYHWLAYQLSEFSLVGDNVSPLMLDRLTPYYSAMFLVKVDFFGKIVEIHFPGNYSNFAGLAQMSSLLEVINRLNSNYKEHQKDAIGSYDTFYRKNSNIIKKQKTKYLTLESLDSRYSVSVEKFTLVGEVDTLGNWLKSLRLSESLKIRDEKREPYAQNKNMVKLEKNSMPIDSTLDIWKEKRDVETILKDFKEIAKTDIDLFKVIADESQKRRFIENKVTITSLIDKLLLDPKNQENYREIAKFISFFPDETYRLGEVVIKGSDSVAMSLISKLSFVGTPQAQKLLSEIARSDETSSMNNIRAIVGLGGVEELDDSSINSLIDISSDRTSEDLEDKSNTSLLALGAHAKKNDVVNEDIMSYIHAEYAGSTSLEREKNILYTMQNAGAENFISEIENSLNSDSIKVRTVAIKTIGTIKDEVLREELLNKQLLIQEDESVKNLLTELLNR